VQVLPGEERDVGFGYGVGIVTPGSFGTGTSGPEARAPITLALLVFVVTPPSTTCA
jgi:hypothetical protein